MILVNVNNVDSRVDGMKIILIVTNSSKYKDLILVLSPCPCMHFGDKVELGIVDDRFIPDINKIVFDLEIDSEHFVDDSRVVLDACNQALDFKFKVPFVRPKEVQGIVVENMRVVDIFHVWIFSVNA